MDKTTGVSKQPGYTQYRGDGSGRDSYILVGNAGLVKPESFKNVAPQLGYKPVPDRSTMFSGPVRKFHGALKEPTVWKYFGDGTGRDSYVVKDSGGLIPPYAGKAITACFYTGLRNYQKSPNASNYVHSSGRGNNRHISDVTQPWFNDNIKKMLTMKSRYQR